MGDKTTIYQDGQKTKLAEIPADGKWYEVVTIHDGDNLSLAQIVRLRLGLLWARLCLRLARLALNLAGRLSDVRIPKWPGRAITAGDDFVNLTSPATVCRWQVTCPTCGAAITYTSGIHGEVVRCEFCHRQIWALGNTIADPDPCDFACGYTEPFGFVPEAGCPVHDPQGEPW